VPSFDDSVSARFRRFVRCVDTLDDPIGVALAIEREIDASVDEAAVRRRVEALAAELSWRTNALPSPAQRIALLGQYLGRECGFTGSSSDYGDPRNALVGRALASKRGLPITLSILYLGVARLAGLPVVGVGLPGHFVVGQLLHEPPLFLDPFRQGRLLERDECDRIVRAVTGQSVATAEPYLRPVAPRALATRVLNNLQIAYWQRRDYPSALLVARMLCAANPASVEPLRARAFVYDRMGRTADALVDYEAFLRRAAEGPETSEVRARVAYLRGRG
jgi:regulator of sirC expression with transglutaminase-like and TPR domain